MLNSALSLIPRETKDAPFIYPALKVPILNLIGKTFCKYLICRMS